MPQKTYVKDDEGKACAVSKLYARDTGGLARKVSKLYVRDANGLARLVYGTCAHNWAYTGGSGVNTIYTCRLCGITCDHDWDYNSSGSCWTDYKCSICNGYYTSYDHNYTHYACGRTVCADCGSGYGVCDGSDLIGPSTDETYHWWMCEYGCGTQFNASKHDFTGVTYTVQPTCEKQGYQYEQCSVCGRTNKHDYTDALGHNEVYTSITSLHYSQSGHKHKVTCSKCNEVFVESEPCTLDHYSNAGDTHFLVCKCGNDIGRDIHNFNGGYTCICGYTCDHTYEDATCTTPKTCSRCGDTIGSALGHDWSAATCTAPKTCSICGATEGDALSHKYITCMVCQEKTYCTRCKTCARCGLK